MSVRITDRSRHFFGLLAAARVGTTGQAYRLYFKKDHRSLDAARKWLRKHVRGGYIRMHRRDRMSEALFTLAPEGLRVLERDGSGQLSLVRTLPKQVEHLVGINDIRVAAELGYELAYFYACWELPALKWREPVVPDALFSTKGRVFAVEYDRGLETISYFMRKVAVYRQGLPGVRVAAVLIVTDSPARMRLLMRAIADDPGRFRFTTIDQVRRHALDAPIFFRGVHGALEKLI